MDRELFVPPGGPPQGPGPSPEIYARLGEEGVVRMLADFYEALALSPLAALFPADPEARRQASRKSADFFCGALGGPPLYARRHGPPRMRARYLPFTIDEPARRAWLACWEPLLQAAPERYGFPPEHLPGFRRFLDEFSAWMVNARPLGL